MELRELAERIVFGETLRDKLANVRRPTDRVPGPPRRAPPLPGRPAELRPSPRIAPFPTGAELRTKEGIGAALGYFANHELLAIEILAMTLLRFPDLPKSERRVLWSTLRDEQRHLRLYLGRMKELDVTFGAHGTSDFFWRAFRGVERIEQFAAGMGLCLEQANLDYATHYREIFRAAGDLRSADILDRVLKDEIIHVKRGLSLLSKRGSPPDLWATWMAHLPRPLTPRRARGNTVRTEPRREAGLPESFIRRLEVWGETKGRPPVLRVFNPDMEARLAGRTPKKIFRHLRDDQQALPLFCASPADVVIVREQPDIDWLAHLRERGFRIPRFETVSDDPPLWRTSNHEEQFASLQPWGWTPRLRAQASVLGERLRSTLPPRDLSDLLRVSSKIHMAATVERWLHQNRATLDPQDSWLAPTEHIGHTVTTIAELKSVLRHHEEMGFAQSVLKMPWSTAGRDRIRTESGDIAGALRWAESRMKSDVGLRIEPWLDRVFDFSTQFHLGPESQARVIGHCHCINDERGQFSGAILGRFGSTAKPSVRRTIFQDRRLSRLVASLRELTATLLPEIYTDQPLGFDHFVYQCPEGGHRIRPAIECNPRWTMGRMSLEIQQRIAPGQNAVWRWLPFTGGPEQRKRTVQAVRDLPVDLDAEGRLLSGAVCTNDPFRAKLHLGLLVVNSDPEFCTTWLASLSRPTDENARIPTPPEDPLNSPHGT